MGRAAQFDGRAALLRRQAQSYQDLFDKRRGGAAAPPYLIVVGRRSLRFLRFCGHR
jgi:hypothetical protein